MKAKTVSLFFRGPAPDGVALYLAAAADAWKRLISGTSTSNENANGLSVDEDRDIPGIAADFLKKRVD